MPGKPISSSKLMGKKCNGINRVLPEAYNTKNTIYSSTLVDIRDFQE